VVAVDQHVMQTSGLVQHKHHVAETVTTNEYAIL
jgi:hypothetical protein